MKHLNVFAPAALALALSACTAPQPRPEAALEALAPALASPSQACYDFDELPLLKQFPVGSRHEIATGTLHFFPYLLGGASYSNGFGWANTWVIADTPPPQFKPYAVVTRFVPHTPASEVRFAFGETLQGLHANFGVNGTSVREFGSLADLDGLTLNGVRVAVTVTRGAKNTGTLTLTADTQDIRSVSFGGRTLYIDDFCHR